MMTAMFSAMTSVLSPGALLWGWPAQAHSHDPQQHEHQTAAAAAALSHHVTTVTITDANIPTIIAQPQLLDMAPVQFEPEFRYVETLRERHLTEILQLTRERCFFRSLSLTLPLIATDLQSRPVVMCWAPRT